MLTTRAVAAALGLSDRTVRLYAASGRIPSSTTPGGHRRFDLDEVRRALQEPPARRRPTLAEVRRHRHAINAAAKRHGARQVRVFGSVASGTADEESDIDLLVRLDRGRSYADVEDLRVELQAILGAPVDVITEGACHGRLAQVPDLAVRL